MTGHMPVLPGARHRRITIDGATLHLAECGPSDAPPVLLVHGWPQNWWCWNRVAPLLADDFRCLMLDLPGHGWSTAPRDGYEKEALADNLLRLLDELEIERVTYVGHDWGALLGFLIGIREPERVSGLVALSIPHLWPALRDRLNPRQLFAFSYQLPLGMPILGPGLMRRGLTRRVLEGADAGFTEEDVEIQSSTMDSPEGAVTTTRLYRTFLVRELPSIALGRYRASRLEVPTRLIVGERDPITRFSSLSGFEQNAPAMQVERVPGAGHFLPQERPDLIAERAIATRVGTMSSVAAPQAATRS
jgi:pimeloyl-ACP methyl ester carboxylesterase